MPGFTEIFGGFSGLKFRLLAASAAIVMGGVLWNGGQRLAHGETIRTGSAESAPSMRSDWAGGASLRREAAEKADRWGDAAVRLGLSFLVAMIFASMLRAFVRTALTAAVAVCGVLWLLHHQGVIEPFWKDYYGAFGEARDWLAGHTDSVKDLVLGYLPSTAAGLMGFGFGLKK